MTIDDDDDDDDDDDHDNGMVAYFIGVGAQKGLFHVGHGHT